MSNIRRTQASGRDAKYCYQCVCTTVHLHISRTTYPNFTNFTHAGEEDQVRPGWITSRHGKDSLWKTQSERQQTEISSVANTGIEDG